MTANVLNYSNQASASGDNAYIFGGTIQTGGSQSLKKIYLLRTLANVSTASTVYLASPVAGTITNIQTIIDGTIATANAVITGKIGSTAITGGAVTIPYSGSAAGQVNSAAPTALNTVAVGSNINFTTNAASTNAVSATITIEITLS